MKYQGINLENVKLSNRSSILLLLNNNGAMSRKDIAETVGLTAASVTLICSELLEQGLIVELGEANEEKRAGRKKILVDINPSFRSVLCIAIESDVTYIAVTDMKGKVLCNTSMNTDREIPPETFLKNVTDECQKLFWKNGIVKEKVLGAAVTIPGSVDRVKGISLNSTIFGQRIYLLPPILKRNWEFLLLWKITLRPTLRLRSISDLEEQ